MSTRTRRRRSDRELLEAATAILFPDELDTDQLDPAPDQPELDGEDAALAQPDELDHLVPDEANPVPDEANPVPDEPNPEQNLMAARPDLTQPDEPVHQQPLLEPAGQMEQLTALTQALQLAGRPSFKPPSFSGVEDVELFLKQFEDVADANRWTPLERTLHIRAQLSGDAHSCGQAEDYEEIVDDLTARYGLNRRKARDRLSSIQLKVGQDIYKQAAEIRKLVKIAFPALPDPDQQAMALDYFSRAWEGKAVPEHLLAIRPATLREAVRATEDFLAVHVSGPRPRAHAVEQVPDEVEQAAAVTTAGLTAMAEAIRTQTALLQQIMIQLTTRQQEPNQSLVQKNRELKCFGCGGPHFKRNCPHQQVTGVSTQQPGNGSGPVQA